MGARKCAGAVVVVIQCDKGIGAERDVRHHLRLQACATLAQTVLHGLCLQITR